MMIEIKFHTSMMAQSVLNERLWCFCQCRFRVEEYRQSNHDIAAWINRCPVYEKKPRLPGPGQPEPGPATIFYQVKLLVPHMTLGGALAPAISPGDNQRLARSTLEHWQWLQPLLQACPLKFETGQTRGTNKGWLYSSHLILNLPVYLCAKFGGRRHRGVDKMAGIRPASILGVRLVTLRGHKSQAGTFHTGTGSAASKPCILLQNHALQLWNSALKSNTLWIHYGIN